MTHCAPLTSGVGICRFNFLFLSIWLAPQNFSVFVAEVGPTGADFVHHFAAHLSAQMSLSVIWPLSYSRCIISNAHIKSKCNHL